MADVPRVNAFPVVKKQTQPFAATWEEAVRRYGDEPALIFDGVGPEVRFSYNDLESRTNRLARNLTAKFDVQEGDMVVTIADNRPELVTLILACLKIGAVFVPLATDLRVTDCYKIINLYEPKLIVCDAPQYAPFSLESGKACKALLLQDYHKEVSLLRELEETGSDAPVPLAELNEEPSLIFSTSGSTGVPKGVVYSRQLMAQMADMGPLGLVRGSPGDRNLLWVHFRGVGGTLVCLTGIIAGMPQVMVDTQPNGPALWTPLLEKHNISTMLLFGAAMNQILQEMPKHTFQDIKYVTYGGSCFPPTLVQKSMEQFPNAEFRQMYGMTEAYPFAFMPHEDHKRASEATAEDLHIMSSAGYPMCDMFIEDMDRPGSGCPPPPEKKGVGQICAHCPFMMSGYYKNPEKTKEARPDGKYMRTGDVGKIDENGRLFILGRVKDIIPTFRGFNVAPRDIEEVLYSHPAVAEAQVVGVTHSCGAGDMVVAWAHPKEGASITADDMRAHCKDAGLPFFQMPEVFNVSSEPLPTNGSKLNKKALQDPAYIALFLAKQLSTRCNGPLLEPFSDSKEEQAATELFRQLFHSDDEAALQKLFGEDAAAVMRYAMQKAPAARGNDVDVLLSCLLRLPELERKCWIEQVGSLIAIRDREAITASGL